MRLFLISCTIILLALPAQAASTLVWVESQEAGTAALAEELQALAGPTDLLRLLTGRQPRSDLAGQALGAVRLAWRQVRLEALTATLDQAQRTLLAQPRRGDAARLAEVYAYRAAAKVMNFKSDEARSLLSAALGLGLKSLPGDLSNTLDALWGELNNAQDSRVELALRTAAGARLWVDDAPWDRLTSPRLVAGIHLIGATQPGHLPVWQWLNVTASGSQATLLPQAPGQLAPVSSQLGAGARGDRNAADAARRSLGVDGLVLCTMTLVAARYDARCTLHTGMTEPRSAIASFLPNEPLSAHAQRIWQGLSAAEPLTIRPGDAGRGQTGRANTLAWTGVALGTGALLVSGWAALQTRATHQQFRQSMHHDLGLSGLQDTGKQFALIADVSLGLGVVFNAAGAYLLRRSKKQAAALDALAGGPK
jgi:hypothetical protein